MKAELLLAEALAATPRLDASSVRLLLAELLDCSPVEIPLKGQVELSAESITRFWDWHARLQQAEPPQYILQKAWFYGLELKVNPSVLIPRPETEGLVELALRLIRPDAGILEIGTGSGAIAIALATHLPQAAILATDSSPAALELARRNAPAHGCHIDFHLCDLFPDTRDSFDLIISNPPYISEDEFASLEPRVRDYEPRQALLAKQDGLEFYHRILRGAKERLAPGGRVLFEHGATQKAAIRHLAQTLGYSCFLAQNDLAGRERYLGFTHIKRM